MRESSFCADLHKFRTSISIEGLFRYEQSQGEQSKESHWMASKPEQVARKLNGVKPDSFRSTPAKVETNLEPWLE